MFLGALHRTVHLPFPAMNTLIAALASAGTVLLTKDQLTAIQSDGVTNTDQISQLNRTGAFKAVVTQWQLPVPVKFTETIEASQEK